MAETEVKTKLTLDDLASEVLERIKGGFEELDQEQKETQSGFGDFARNFASTFAAVNLVPVIKQMRDFAMSIVDVARAADDAAQNIGGFLAGTAGYTWKEARAEGERLHQVVLDMAVDIGQSSDDIERGFKNLMTWMGGGQRAFEFGTSQLRDMTQIANVMGLSVTQIGQGVGQMAAGFIQTRSPMFALLRGTGIFADRIEDTVKEWRELTEEQRLQRLEGAIKKVAGNLGEASPTLSDMITSMKEAGKMLVEAFGVPMINELKPAFEEITRRMREGRRDIAQFAQVLGRDVGKWVRGAADTIEEGFEYIRTHSDEIKSAITTAFSHAKAVVEWIIANRKLIAVAFGAQVAAPAIGAAARTGGAIYKAGAAGTAAAGMTGAAGGAMALASFAVAVGSAALAVEQFTLLLGEMKGEEAKDAEARKKALQQLAEDYSAWDEASARHFRQLGKAFIESADAINMTESEARSFVNELEAAQQAGRSMRERVDAAAMQIESIQEGLEIGKWEDPEQAITNMNAMADYLGKTFQHAVDTGNIGQQKYIASLLAQSSDLQNAFLQSGEVTAKGFMALADMVKDQASSFWKRLTGQAETMTKAATPKAPSINMSGGQVFKIQQDFRDQDPDRVLVAFRKDLVSAATRRLQARGASPFGT